MNKRKITSLLLAVSISLSASTLTSCSKKEVTDSTETIEQTEEKKYADSEIIILDTNFEDNATIKEGIDKRFILLAVDEITSFIIEEKSELVSIATYKDLNNEEYKAIFTFITNTETGEYLSYMFGYNSEINDEIYYYTSSANFEVKDLGWFYTPNMLVDFEAIKESYTLEELKDLCNKLNEKEQTKTLEKTTISL